MKSHKTEVIASLQREGISYNDAETLRNIAMTLHRWHELECGIDGGCIERDEKTGETFWHYSFTGQLAPIPDRETGALTRLGEVLSNYPALNYYVQGDPRGASLYILRPGDVPAGADVNSYYSRGIAVYK